MGKRSAFSRACWTEFADDCELAPVRLVRCCEWLRRKWKQFMRICLSVVHRPRLYRGVAGRKRGDNKCGEQKSCSGAKQFTDRWWPLRQCFAPRNSRTPVPACGGTTTSSRSLPARTMDWPELTEPPRYRPATRDEPQRRASWPGRGNNRQSGKMDIKVWKPCHHRLRHRHRRWPQRTRSRRSHALSHRNQFGQKDPSKPGVQAGLWAQLPWTTRPLLVRRWRCSRNPGGDDRSPRT